LPELICLLAWSLDDDSATERLMPTIPDIPGPYRFFFYSFDCNEPMHVHVERDRESCKFWLEPLALAANRGFSAKELNRIRVLIADHLGVIRNAWSRHCSRA
jgi:hypothetical protein